MCGSWLVNNNTSSSGGLLYSPCSSGWNLDVCRSSGFAPGDILLKPSEQDGSFHGIREWSIKIIQVQKILFNQNGVQQNVAKVYHTKSYLHSCIHAFFLPKTVKLNMLHVICNYCISVSPAKHSYSSFIFIFAFIHMTKKQS